jgi:type I restriction-modification system DNA methylase subunit
MNEWEFTGEAVSWINQSLERNPSLPFSRAKVEQQGQGSRKRRDLTLLDKNQRVVLTGEIKLPYEKDGSSPYNDTVVRDARSKAQRAGSRFFFTWNVNEFVLWETTSENADLQDQKYKSWKVTSVHKENYLDIEPTLQSIQSWLDRFLKEFAEILRGTAPIGIKPPDEQFIDSLESYLHLPIVLTLEQLIVLYRTPQFKRDLDKWMREEQGWTITDDDEGIQENLENAAKFACYALINKLVFHEALLKRYRSVMESLTVPEHIDLGEQLRLHLEKYFAEAKDVTGDYETVFGEDHRSIGNRIPFYSDRAVSHWRELINQIHKFDFSKLDYEIIGKIFERLISPEERHKYGQYYTRPEVVDLINSFCIQTGEEKIMDPACGGGTFLVRAYARKRELAPARRHSQLISDIFGIDISHFASHLTTINLATRDLVEEENYPQIARNDFFDVMAHKAFISLPHRVETKGLGKIQHKSVEIPSLDAVVGNPPYVRQEDIPKSRNKNKNKDAGTKEYYQKLVKDEAGADFSGRSDLHCYFWPHASTFLKNNGYLCLLTSSQWLDVEYGFRLQQWILNNFRIIAIFESIDEPWFVGARVATTITILQREPNETVRAKNTVRFVQLRRPLGEILSHDGTTAGAVTAADRFRDEILGLSENTVNQRYRARLVNQGYLWKSGVDLGNVIYRSSVEGTSIEDENEDVEKVKFRDQTGKYFGSKWGVYVRAPDFWFRLLDEHGNKFEPLGKLADIRRGITSGNDGFFFPIDSSSECLQASKDNNEFMQNYGVPRKLVENGMVKLVRAGEGHSEIHPIESHYLEPEVHSLMEIDGFTVSSKDCRHLALLINDKKTALKGTYVLNYIKWGESNGVHKGSTCAARITPDREWYDLTGHVRGALFWSKSQQYKHAIPANDNNLLCSSNLYDILPRDVEPTVLGGI